MVPDIQITHAWKIQIIFLFSTRENLFEWMGTAIISTNVWFSVHVCIIFKVKGFKSIEKYLIFLFNSNPDATLV